MTLFPQTANLSSFQLSLSEKCVKRRRASRRLTRSLLTLLLFSDIDFHYAVQMAKNARVNEEKVRLKHSIESKHVLHHLLALFYHLRARKNTFFLCRIVLFFSVVIVVILFRHFEIPIHLLVEDVGLALCCAQWLRRHEDALRSVTDACQVSAEPMLECALCDVMLP